MSTNGIATAVALAGGAGDLGLNAGEQPELFEEADTALPISPAPRGKSGPKGGRPTGARNRATEEARQLFLSRYRSPLFGLGEVYSRSPEDLARELHMTRTVEHLAPGQVALETRYSAEGKLLGYVVWDRARAFEMQRDCMVAALPYVERKQPIAIDTHGKVAGMIVIGDLAGLQDGGDGTLTLDLVPNDSEQNQQVSEGASVRLANEQSDGEANAVKSQEESR